MTLRIKGKILLISVGILFATIAADNTISSIFFSSQYYHALEARGFMVANSLKYQLDRLVGLHIPLNNLVGFDEQCQDIVKKYNDISYAMIVDIDGRILFHNSPSKQGERITDANLLKGIHSKQDNDQKYFEKGEEYLAFIIPVFGPHNEHIGATIIGFPTKLISQKTTSMIVSSFVVAFFFLGSGIIFLIVSLNFWVTKPLGRLLTVINGIRQKGTETAPLVTITSKDEIGELSSAFNEMILELKEFHGKMRNDAKELEVKILESTTDLQEANAKLKQDIAERMKVEAELREQFHFLQTLIDTIPSPIFYKSINGTYLGCNLAFEHYLGLPRDQIIGRTEYDIASPNLARRYVQMDQALFQQPGVQVHEVSTQYADGNRHQVIVTKATFTKTDGSLGGLVGVMLDITERQQMEMELRRAHAEMAQLLAALPSLLIGLSPENCITQWNPAAAAIFGVEAAAVLGQGLHEAGPKWDWTKVDAGTAACRREHQPIRVDDVPFQRPDGRDGFLGLTFSSIRNDEHSPAGLLILGSDITERRILQAQLAQAQKLESIGQLAAGIAHEINTPIQYVGDNTRFLQDAFRDLVQLIQDFQELLAASKLGQVTAEILQQVDTALTTADLEYLTAEIPQAIDQTLEGVERVARIVRSMKDFSHPGTTKKAATDLNKAIDSAITVTHNEWKYVAELITDLEPTLPLVPCLPGEFNQVMLNLIINAVHAIGQVVDRDAGERGIITVSTRQNDNWAEIRVSDTGPGIPPEIQNKIFDPFFTTKEVGKGTGQGLAIAHRVIYEKHQGDIVFESEVGRGATFIIRLPLDG